MELKVELDETYEKSCYEDVGCLFKVFLQNEEIFRYKINYDEILSDSDSNKQDVIEKIEKVKLFANSIKNRKYPSIIQFADFKNIYFSKEQYPNDKLYLKFATKYSDFTFINVLNVKDIDFIFDKVYVDIYKYYIWKQNN